MILNKVSKIISNLSKGVVTDYALYILIGVCFYLSIFTFLSVFFDLIDSITIACVFILILIGSQSFYHNMNSSDENLMSSMFVLKRARKIIFKFIFLILRALVEMLRDIVHFISYLHRKGLIRKIIITTMSIYIGNFSGLEVYHSDDGSDTETNINNKEESEPQKETFESKYRQGFMNVQQLSFNEKMAD
jgi:hypothetical protein